jgi:hypothetical protein
VTAALIVGAGFSCAAGLPLTRDLFDCKELPLYHSDKDRLALEEVSIAYRRWRESNPSINSEVWMAALYEAGASGRQRFGTNWENALQFALRRLVDLRNVHPGAYYHGICTHQVHPTHKRFWKFVNEHFNLKTIVSLNYDLLIEQALHEEGSTKRNAPQCYYGGFQYNQIVLKMTNVAKRESEPVTLGHKYTLYKLHGSINWAWEHSLTMKIHDDVRAIFRRTPKHWKPAVIAPIPEKDMPKEFSQIWNEAGKSLEAAETWIVCGYSMPDFDLALSQFFRSTISTSQVQSLYISDPNSVELASKWQVPGKTIKVKCLPGLPEALDCNWFSDFLPHSISRGGQYELFS